MDVLKLSWGGRERYNGDMLGQRLGAILYWKKFRGGLVI